MEGKKDMLNWEQKTLVSELISGLEAAKKLHARLGEPSSLPPSSSPLAAEMNEILMKQILSSYEKSLAIVNWSLAPPVQLILKAGSVAPVTLIPESPVSINGSPRSEDFLDGGGSSNTHRQDHIFNSKKRKMLPKWTEKVRMSPERGLEGPHQDDVYSWRKYDVFSFPNTPPFYDYGTPNDYFGGLMESSPIFDVVDWFNPTVEINPEFPTFLPDSIYY
ncbi:hypothetical protein DY000_02027196 [Brassica cretica]|uniref:WRKY domain-containing protein n=1 Tax=Brassica cretica TaxID=69181 RepID=A0ABQ7ELZ6_BRACR|nr:hypothetical protein DY000_02027196 [Brassica cretica]